MADVKWRLSNDGKTVTAGGKTYSLSAFQKQFSTIVNKGNTVVGPNALKFDSGTAVSRNKSVQQVSAKTADEAKAKADKKAAKKAASSLKAAKTPVKGKAAEAARTAAKKRAAATAPTARSSGQKYTLRGGAGGGMFGIKNR